MKKLLTIGLISIGLSASLAEARFFLGIDLGYDFSGIDGESPNRSGGEKGTIRFGTELFGHTDLKFHSGVAGLNLGTQHDLNDVFGLRWFFGLSYAQSFNRGGDLQALNFALGIDTLFNFTSSFGAFAGIEAAFSAHDYVGKLFASGSKNEMTNDVGAGASGRVGLAFIVDENSRFELTARIPIMQAVLSRKGGFLHRPLRFTLGYKYVF